MKKMPYLWLLGPGRSGWWVVSLASLAANGHYSRGHLEHIDISSDIL